MRAKRPRRGIICKVKRQFHAAQYSHSCRPGYAQFPVGSDRVLDTSPSGWNSSAIRDCKNDASVII